MITTALTSRSLFLARSLRCAAAPLDPSRSCVRSRSLSSLARWLTGSLVPSLARWLAGSLLPSLARLLALAVSLLSRFAGSLVPSLARLLARSRCSLLSPRPFACLFPRSLAPLLAQAPVPPSLSPTRSLARLTCAAAGAGAAGRRGDGGYRASGRCASTGSSSTCPR
jgi:hypothetical protein